MEIETVRKEKPIMKSSTVEKGTENDAEVIGKLKERIASMAKGSKGISVKNIKITKAIKQFCKDNGFSLSGETLFVNHVNVNNFKHGGIK